MGRMMSWQIWMMVGISFMILEVALLGDFFIFFFGLGGLATGLILLVLEYSGIHVPSAYPYIAWAASSVVLMIFFRKRLLILISSGREHEIKDISGYAGKEGNVVEANILPHERGMVIMNQTKWDAINISDVELEVDDRIVVESLEGLTLKIRGKLGNTKAKENEGEG